jgi:hypothetical protein
MSDYDFALQWLDYLGNKVYYKGKQILCYDGENPDYDINPLETSIRIGQELGDDEEETEYTILGFTEIEQLGFTVKADRDYTWKNKKRKVGYKIIRQTSVSVGMTSESYRKATQNKSLRTQHDAPNKRIRLIGDNVIADKGMPIECGIGPWIQYAKNEGIKSTRKKTRSMFDFDDSGKNALDFLGDKVSNNEDEEEFPNVRFIPEIPILFADERYIVCIPKEDACQRIIVVGESGFGKSIAVNGMAGRVVYKFEDPVGWLIDPLNQLHDLSLPQEYSVFIDTLEMINEEPMPIPAVQYYLGCRHQLNIRHPNISMILTLNFIKFLNKIEYFTFGIKDYDLKGTRRYLMDLKKEMANMRDGEEIKKLMYCKIPNAKDKGMGAMIYKWKNSFEKIFEERFTSNVYDEYETVNIQDEKFDIPVVDKLTVELANGRKMTGHPFIMSMEAGLVPVINVSKARRQPWIRNYLADLMQEIVAHQMDRDGDNDEQRMWIIADELNEVYEKGKKKDNCYTAFEELFRQGRINNLGFIGNTQSLDKLNPEMYGNATHICAVQIKKGSERKKIGSDFKVGKGVYEKMAKLKKGEMMVFSNQPFIIYDQWGRRKVEKDRNWFKGKIIPPVNFHKPPKKVSG